MEEGDFKDWLFLIRGTRQLREALEEDVSQSLLAPLIKYGAERWVMQCQPSDAGTRSEDEMLERLKYLINSQVTDQEKLTVYNETINKLGAAAHSSHQWEGLDAFIWIYRCSDDFLPLLNPPTQEALAILAYFASMLQKLEAQWWLRGWADHIMSFACSQLDAEHMSWIHPPAEHSSWGIPATWPGSLDDLDGSPWGLGDG